MKAVERIKVASVYIGAIVGAGFATGKEIILFFGDGGYIAPLVTGVLMGAFCPVFLYVGRVAARLRRDGVLSGKVFNAAKIAFILILELCMLLTMTTMIGGMQKLFGDRPQDKIAGFVLAAMCVGLSSLGASAVRRINLALVPVLFLLLATLYFKSSGQTQAMPFNILKSVNYLSMNMLLGGCLAVKDGERASNTDMAVIGAICAGVLGTMMFFVYSAASDYPMSEMPIYSLCQAKGIGAVGAVAVGIAILTTLAGAAKSLGDGIYAVLPSRAGVTSVLLLLTLASYGWEFASAVSLFYPFIAAVASAVFVLIFTVFAVYAVKTRVDKIVLKIRLRQSDRP